VSRSSLGRSTTHSARADGLASAPCLADPVCTNRASSDSVVYVDRWDDGDAYDAFMGRWSEPLAARFVDWLRPEQDRRWLDVGCGTGALLSTILDFAAPESAAGVEPSAGFAAAAARRFSGRAEIREAAAGDLPFESGSFDYVVSGLVLNFVPDAAKAIGEMTRATRPGGTVGAYVWDYAAGMRYLRAFWDAAIAVDPEARSSTRRSDSRTATRTRSEPCSAMPGCTRWRRRHSSSRCGCTTWTTGGLPCSVARVRPLATSPPSTTTTGPSCGVGLRRCCPSRRTARCR
jgi:SAM-dependent methyltransferase